PPGLTTLWRRVAPCGDSGSGSFSRRSTVNDPRHSNSAGGGPRANGPGARPPRPRLSGRARLILLGLVILVNLVFYAPFLRTTSREPQISLSYSTFLAQVRAHNVTTAHLSATMASGAFARPYPDPAS